MTCEAVQLADLPQLERRALYRRYARHLRDGDSKILTGDVRRRRPLEANLRHAT